MYSRGVGYRRSVSWHGTDDKTLLLLQLFPTRSAQSPLLFDTFSCRTQRLSPNGTLGVALGAGVWGGREPGTGSHLLHTHSPVIMSALQILHICLALHRSALLLPSPHHLRFPPTSPLPHQDHPNISPRCFLKLPWVTRPHAQIMLACRGGAGQRGRE